MILDKFQNLNRKKGLLLKPNIYTKTSLWLYDSFLKKSMQKAVEA
jgi:hypothetical protein